MDIAAATAQEIHLVISLSTQRARKVRFLLKSVLRRRLDGNCLMSITATLMQNLGETAQPHYPSDAAAHFYSQNNKDLPLYPNNFGLPHPGVSDGYGFGVKRLTVGRFALF